MEAFDNPLSNEEEITYLRRLKEGDKAAKEVLIKHNLRLVAHIIKKYPMTEHEHDDLLSIGTIGLIKAIDTFNPDKGPRLATYAAKCIDNELLMVLRSDKRRGREVSLNEPFGTDKEGNEICLSDVTYTEDEDVVLRLSRNDQLRYMINAFDEVLTVREQKILTYRYGLFGSLPLTQREIAEKYGISRSYVSRIEKKALSKLKDKMRKEL